MYKTLLVSIIAISISGCCSNKMVVRTLDATIIDAATYAKAAGADELSVELSVITAYEGEVSLPVSVVTVGGKTSKSNSTKVTTKIKDLKTWIRPSNRTIATGEHTFLAEPDDRFILNTKTLELQRLK